MSATPPASAEPLLERSRELSLLERWMREAQAGAGGRVALVAGEAGVGKSTLLRRAAEDVPDGTRIIWGACDSLFTPQPLGPLLDIAEQTGGELAELVESGATPHPVATALLRELAGRRAALLVIEDLHWADESSLDVLRIIARRIGSVPVLLLVSYRSEGLERGDPLRLVLGELATAERVSRLALQPLSPGAVAELAVPRGVDAERLYRATGGNPFYVTEVLAAGNDKIPDNVRDAVHARIDRLTPEARQLLEAAAIVPPPVDIALLDALAPNSVDRLDECLTAGVLTTVTGGLAFRHELARLAVEESLPARARTALHRHALAVLSADASAEVARLAQHAEAAGDAEAVLRFAPAAAGEAAAVGAHRVAAAQLARALRFVDDAPSAIRGPLLDQQTFETTLIGEYSAALEVGREALACWRAVGDQLKEGRALSSLAWPLWSLSATAEAESKARAAVELLEQLPAGFELMATYVQLASMLWASAPFDALEWGKKGLDLAEHVGDGWWKVQAELAIAVATWWCNPKPSWVPVEDALALARREGVDGAVGFGYSHLTGMAMCFAKYAEAEKYASDGIEYCAEHDLDSYTPQLVAMRGDAQLTQGRWSEAAASAALVLAGHGAGPATFTAFATTGRLRSRRGDPNAWEALDEAKRMSDPSGELWRIGPVAAARAEAAWLEGRNEAVVKETDAAMEMARRREAGWVLGELGVWRNRAGHEESLSGAIEPWASELAGDWAGAASRWRELGSEYDAALALAQSDDDEGLRHALGALQAMGAAPAAAIVARRLRSRGARGLPRGPRRTTRANPGNLTSRELEILGLVAEGMRNGEIADRLFVSEKTVAHHVSAILRKLGVHTRGEAAAASVRLGLAGPNGGA